MFYDVAEGVAAGAHSLPAAAALPLPQHCAPCPQWLSNALWVALPLQLHHIALSAKQGSLRVNQPLHHLPLRLSQRKQPLFIFKPFSPVMRQPL